MAESVRKRDFDDRLLRRLRLNKDDFDLRGPWESYDSSRSGSGSNKRMSEGREAVVEVL